MKTKKLLMIRRGSPQLFVTTVICAFLMLSSQGFDEEQQEIIDRGVEIKIEDFIKRQQTRCWERALSTAVTRVDSMVRAGALEMRIDPVIKPPRPDRPSKPAIKQLPDSMSHSKMLND